MRTNLNKFQFLIGTWFSRLLQQTCHTRHRRSSPRCLRDPHEVCNVHSWSGDESYPAPTKTHHSGYQSQACNHSSRGRNQPSRPVSFGTLSTPHRGHYDHSIRQMHLSHQGRLCKHRWSCHLTCTPHHSFFDNEWLRDSNKKKRRRKNLISRQTEPYPSWLPGGTQERFIPGGCPVVQLLTPLHAIFHRKGALFVYPLLTNGTSFTYLV